MTVLVVADHRVRWNCGYRLVVRRKARVRKQLRTLARLVEHPEASRARTADQFGMACNVMRIPLC